MNEGKRRKLVTVIPLVSGLDRSRNVLININHFSKEERKKTDSVLLPVSIL